MQNAQVKNQQRKSWVKTWKDISYQSKRLIYFNNYENTTVTFAMTFLNTTGEENLYSWFEYALQKIYNHAQIQVSGSINCDLINTNKQVNNQLL